MPYPPLSTKKHLRVMLLPWTGEELKKIDQLHGGHEAHALAVGGHVTQHREQAVVQRRQAFRSSHEQLVNGENQQVQMSACAVLY